MQHTLVLMVARSASASSPVMASARRLLSGTLLGLLNFCFTGEDGQLDPLNYEALLNQ